MDTLGFHLAFWSLAAVTLGGALLLVATRNLIHALIYLVLSFIGVAGLYLTLSAEFIAMVQILVYAGAIAVLMLFAIMLTPQASRDNSETTARIGAVMVLGLFAAAAVFVAVDTDWATVADVPVSDSARIIGESLINEFVLPFEIGAVLLTAALVGAVALAREDPEDQGPQADSLRQEAMSRGDAVPGARPAAPSGGDGRGGGGT